MPAYNRGDEKVDAYLVRILSAIVREHGGELRVKGHLIDEVNEATTLIKEWDKQTNELVLRAGMHSFTEVFRVVPTKQETREAVTQAVDPLERHTPGIPNHENPTRSTSTVDNPRLAEMERKRTIAQAAATIKRELDRRRNMSEQ